MSIPILRSVGNKKKAQRPCGYRAATIVRSFSLVFFFTILFYRGYNTDSDPRPWIIYGGETFPDNFGEEGRGRI